MLGKLTAIVLALVAWCAPALAGSPAISTGYKDVSLDAPSCTARMHATLTSNGFTRTEVISNSTFGDFGDYQMTIRCIPEKALAVIAVAGPQVSECDRLVKLILGQI